MGGGGLPGASRCLLRKNAYLIILDLPSPPGAPPPPGGSRPQLSMSDDRFERAAPSIEPSVAETASEGDWLGRN
ncbi:hypothetical protein BGW80DRAFT_1319476 [Lactifluus volemus]|nr:hypothetical protein BGW80DRAFT_1319476 [Lactifluus volemus]